MKLFGLQHVGDVVSRGWAAGWETMTLIDLNGDELESGDAVLLVSFHETYLTAHFGLTPARVAAIVALAQGWYSRTDAITCCSVEAAWMARQVERASFNGVVLEPSMAYMTYHNVSA